MRVLTIVLDYMSFLPPAFLCFLPMKDQLKYSLRKTLVTVCGAMFCAMLLFGGLQFHFNFESNCVLLPMLAVYFFAFKSCHKATLWQSLSIMCASLALMSILSNIAICSGVLLFYGDDNILLNSILPEDAPHPNSPVTASTIASIKAMFLFWVSLAFNKKTL